MLEATVVGAVTFVVIFVVLRLLEFGYHKFRHMTDWSPHWGSWAFAVLAGLFTFASSWGR